MQGFQRSIGCLLLAASLFVCMAGNGQTSSNEILESVEMEMVRHLEVLGDSNDEKKRISASDSLRLNVIDVLDIEGCFDYDFSKVLTMSILKSSDNKVRIFNWNLPYDDETHKYFCFVLQYDKKTKISSWQELIESEKELRKVESKYLKTDQWMGALYYEIIPVKVSKTKTYYTLLGWDGNDRNTTKKVIDALSFTGSKLKLGAPIFKSDKGTQKRFIIEYGSDVVVSLRWHEKDKRIVFDHVAPRDPMMTGVYSYYGPDMTYDAFNLEKGKWVLETKVEVVNSKSDKNYNDPRSKK